MRVILVALTFLLLASTAVAGPNAGGVLVMHATTLAYTTDIVSYEGMSGVACGQDGPPYPDVQQCPPYDPWEGADPCDPSAANPTSAMPAEVPHIWYILAAFPPESCPRLHGLAFRIQYDPAKVAVIANGASDSEVAIAWPVPSDLDGSSFPNNRSGMRLAWETRTSLLQEVWWFAGYSYSGATDATFAVNVLEGEGDDSFLDDSFPGNEDEIAGFGTLGLGGTAGSNPSWEDATGACCHPDASCSVTLEAGCLSSGFWQGVGTTCAPNPCSAIPPPGAIVTWGRNEVGQCYVPLPNTGFVSVAAAGFFSGGLKSDGSIEGWGNCGAGQCSVPPPNADFVAIAAGWQNIAGLKSDGTVQVWGGNGDGQCDIPTPNADFVAVSVRSHILALKSDGTIVAWGSNGSGECDVPTPNADFVAVAAGGGFSLGLKADGRIVAWGDDYWHQCEVPAPNTGFVAISAGGGHGLGLKADGSIVAWGYAGWGQCDVPSPNSGFVAVSAGGAHSLGLKADGTIVAWGQNTYGQCDVPALNGSFVAISAGGYHSMGLLSGGTMSGACCLPDGTCTLTLPADCQLPSVWQGSGTICTPNACEPTPVLLESSTALSLTEGLQIRWEVPLGATGARYRTWRDPAAGPHDVVPTPDAVLLSSAWISASADGIIETLDREAARGTTVRYFLETDADGGEFIGSVGARWDPPALAWSAGPTPFHDTVRLTPPAAGPAQARIFDLAGRLVRTLVRAGGDVPLEWDGRSDAGRETPAGVYLVKVAVPGGETNLRVVLTR